MALEMRPDCERCGADLPAQAPGAFICSFECTYCAECAEALDDRCPTCGGELTDRPTRAKQHHDFGAAIKGAEVPGVTARILIIAGSDSGGGAGIQADIKTVTMLGGHAMTAITAITAQNTLGVRDVLPLPLGIVEAQYRAVVEDIGVDAVKLGMLGTPELVDAVARLLATLPQSVPVVFDPVMIATSGDALSAKGTAAAMRCLLPLAALVTPNLPELTALGGEGAILAEAPAVLIKGGHGEGPTIVDRLLTRAGEVARWEGARIETTSTHGTGCTLASAIATGLGQGMTMSDAIERGRLFVRAALEAAPGLGGGHGPMGHQAVRGL